ncbi:MAG: hypothetical protein LAQ69_03400 [Acidobacteriia bacterium]|nr:hypothetical protein [Terriglobia bacterium]
MIFWLWSIVPHDGSVIALGGLSIAGAPKERGPTAQRSVQHSAPLIGISVERPTSSSEDPFDGRRLLRAGESQDVIPMS